MLLISLLAISAVSATDSDNATDVVAADESTIEEVQSVDNKVEVLSDSQDGTDLLTEDEPQQLNLVVDEIEYGENATVNVSIDKNITEYEGCNVSVLVDGCFLCNITLDNQGKGSYYIPEEKYDVGSYNIVAGLFDKTNNFICLNQTVLKISKAVPTINVKNVTVKYGEKVTIPFNVTDRKGRGISGDVIVTILWENDSLSKHVRITNGSAKVPFELSDLIGIFNSNGTSFNISGLFGGNNTNKSTFNITGLFGGDGNGTFNITNLFGGNGTFNISDFLNGNSTLNIQVCSVIPHSISPDLEEMVQTVPNLVLEVCSAEIMVSDLHIFSPLVLTT